MSGSIEDFVLRFVFDDDKTAKNVKKLAKDLDGIEAKSKVRSKNDTKRATKRRDQSKEELTLGKAQLALKKKINRAEELGLKTTSAKKTLSGAKKIVTLKKRELELDNQITDKIKSNKNNVVDTSKIKNERNFQKMQDAHSKEMLRDTRQRLALARKEKTISAQINERMARKKFSNNSSTLINAGGKSAMYANQKLAAMQAALNKRTSQGRIEFIKLSRELDNVAAGYRKAQRQALKLDTIQSGLRDSTRNLVRSYASLYALFESTTSINRIGTSLEGSTAAMKLTADTAEGVAENMKFVRVEAKRMGLDVVNTSKSFVKLAAASKGKMGEADIKELFLGIAEAGSVMQLSMDDINGSMRAVVQMTAKGKISAEEYRQQLNIAA